MKLILQAIKALFRKIEASRTHWDTRKIVTKDYIFDGNIDGKETIQIREGTLLVKVDDTFPEVSSITNLSVVYTDIPEGSVEEYELSLGDVSMEGDIYSFDGDAYYTPHGGEYEGVYIPSGLYFRYQIDIVYVSKLSVTNAYGELKKLDIKYIPDEIRKMPSKMDKQNPTGTGSFSLNRRTNTTIGTMSFAEGTDTTASGIYSHAEGNSTTASGDNSHAEGSNTTASGSYSHAEGYLTTASGIYSHAEGNSTTASGENSHAEDYRTTASGKYSHAEGNSTNKFSSIVTATNPTDAAIIAAWKNNKFSLAKGTSSHVEGRDSLALSDYSHAEGYCTTASNTASHAEGLNTIASDNYSHAEGYNTTASNAASHAEGNYTTASGIYSHAEGSFTTASGDRSHTEGKNTIASGISSHAEGSSTNEFSSVVTATNPTNADIITAWKSKKFSLAKGNSSHVEGEDNLALANYSHAEGASNIASGYESHAEGFYTTASGNYSHAEGAGTTASFDYSHAEGSGTTASGYDSHAEGCRTTALSHDSHAEGYSTNTFSSVVTKANPTNDDIITAWGSKKFSVAKGTSSHVEGQDSLALGEYAHAEGSNTTASGQSSHAEGFFTKASGVYQHAQGKYNIEDSAGTYADIIGNGTSDTARSNAATVDWSGNAWYAGNVYVGSTSGTNKDAGSKKLATEEYVNSVVPEIPKALPNPYALTFTGAVTGSYDGSEAVSVEIPRDGYIKPDSGIPKSDLSNEVQTSLSKADTALQEHQDISGKVDKSDIVQTTGQSTTAVMSQKAVTDEINAIKSDLVQLSEEIADKLPKNQGAANVGKILVVGTDGNLTLTDMPASGASGDVIGTLDEANNILLTGNLADGTYTLKYENADGTYTEIGTLEVGAIPEPEPTKTNFFVVGGDGYLNPGRASSNGANRTDITTCLLSNYIEVQNGDEIYAYRACSSNANVGLMALYKADKTGVGFYVRSNPSQLTNISMSDEVDIFTINYADAAYMRVCCLIPSDLSTIVINIKRNGEWL